MPRLPSDARAKVERVTVTVRLETRCYLARLDRRAPAEIAAASIKGVLRFWWRALAWPRIGGGRIADPDQHAVVLREIALEEARIFGYRALDERGRRDLARAPGDAFSEEQIRGLGAAPVRFAIRHVQPVTCQRNLAGAGARYLAYGVTDRDSLAAGTTFRLELSWWPGRLDDALRHGLLDALEVWGLIGGLGARSRRGLGSVRIVDWEGDAVADRSVPHTIDAYVRRLDKLLDGTRPGVGGTLAPYSAFGPDASLHVLTPGEKLEDAVGEDAGMDAGDLALNRLGAGLLWYRSNGRGGTIKIDVANPQHPEPAAGRFGRDKVWFGRIRADRTRWEDEIADPAALPHRIVFGLPHNYFSNHRGHPDQPNYKPRTRLELQGQAGERSRRASPLFLHVLGLGGDHVYVALVLPARFRPTDANVAQVSVTYSDPKLDTERNIVKNDKGRIRYRETPSSALATLPVYKVADFDGLKSFPGHEVDGAPLFNVRGRIGAA